MSDKTKGLYGKYHVERTDGKSAPGQKHAGCDYFVVDITHDKFAMAALLAYARACEGEYPLLAADLRRRFENVAVKPEKEVRHDPPTRSPAGPGRAG